MTERSSPGVSNEAGNERDRIVVTKLFFDRLEALLEVAFAEEQRPVRLAHCGNGFGGKLPSPHADDVDADQARKRAGSDPKRDDVAPHARDSADHGVRADVAELMDRRQPAYDHIVADDAMTGERGTVGEDHVVADPAIMGDMTVGHEKPAVADFGNP